MLPSCRLIIVLLLLICSKLLFSQNLYVSAGINNSKMLVYDNESYNGVGKFKSENGFQIGIYNEFPINKMLSLESGLSLINRNYSYKLLSFRDFQDEEYKTYYLKIPAIIKLSIRYNQFSRVFINAGPYFSLGIEGNVKIIGNPWYGAEDENRKIKWGYKPEDDIKSLDTGLSCSIGIECKSFQFIMGYEYGLSKLTNLNRISYHNSSYVINIAYRISGNSVK